MASPHFGTEEIEILNENYGARWIGKNGRWPDLKTSDFCLWDCMKSRMYRGGKPEGRHQLVEAITEDAGGIVNELQWQTSMAKGLAACIVCESRNLGHVS
jgi:hypothetical protein